MGSSTGCVGSGGTGPGNFSVKTGAKRSGQDPDTGSSQIRFYLAGAAETSAGVKINAVAGVVVCTNGDGKSGITGTGNDRIRIGAKKSNGIRDESTTGKP